MAIVTRIPTGQSGLRTRLGNLVAWLPEGRALPEQTWARRHQLIVRFAPLQAVGVACFGLTRGLP